MRLEGRFFKKLPLGQWLKISFWIMWSEAWNCCIRFATMMLYEENITLQRLDQVLDDTGEAQNQTRSEDPLTTRVLNQSPSLSKPFRGGCLIIRH